MPPDYLNGEQIETRRGGLWAPASVARLLYQLEQSARAA
jgi:hypothetical protein